MNDLNIVPRPAEIRPAAGCFRFSPSTRLRVSDDAVLIGRYFQEIFRPSLGFPPRIEAASSGAAGAGDVLLTTSGADACLGDEGYQLTAAPEALVIRASKPNGLLHGIQSLRQLLPPEIERRDRPAASWSVPAVVIRDKPRFAWRGLHLDAARRHFPLEFIKRFIDLMALHKLNVFHWHLTDDQGWRIEIGKYPRLTEIGARRAATPVPADPRTLDGQPYGGFYTRAQARQIVAYAAARGVTVVPEIEMPGHSAAALASYPWLGCTGGPYSVRVKWGIEEEVLCAGNEKVYEFITDVLDEVLDIFPSRFIHVGGDECPKTRWKQCPKCQSALRRHGLKDEHRLQSLFIGRIAELLQTRGRRLIGWDEILEGGLAPCAAVMSWRGSKGGFEAVKAGHQAVMSPDTHCYFDHYQTEDAGREPPAHRGVLPLEKVYSFEPVPPGLTPEEAALVLGGQGNLWTEYMPGPSQVEYMAFPRAEALAEALWSPPEARDFVDFSRRLDAFLARLDVLGVNYRKPVRPG